jgi:hypothetical protein
MRPHVSLSRQSYHNQKDQKDQKTSQFNAAQDAATNSIHHLPIMLRPQKILTQQFFIAIV